VIDDDREWVTQLMTEAYRWGIQVVRATDPTQAISGIERACPDGVIINASANLSANGSGSTSSTATIEFVQVLKKRCPKVPIWVISQDSDADIDRLGLSQESAQGFFRKSIPLSTLMGVINRSLLEEEPSQSVPEAKVMVVDDDALMLSLLKGILEPWGMQVTTCNDPRQARAMLYQVQPDLMVLDFEMPEMNGIEVCQQVRQDAHTATLPILFLTAHRDPDTVQKVYSAGADDYVSKPVIAPELMTRIFNRLERSQLFREQTQRDRLTQCWNQEGSQVRFEHLIQEAERLHQPICFAVMGIKNLLELSHQKGYTETNHILLNIADSLRDTLPMGSSIARWNSGEFVMLMPGMDRRSGEGFLKEAIVQIQNRLKPETVVQFTTGISEVTPSCKTLMTLYQTIL
jgi:PleD family two-component response regulator